MSIVTTDVNGESLPCKFFMDDYSREVFNDLNEAIKRNWDCVILYVGYEGDGKTTKAMTDALYLDHNFSLERVVFTARQFEQAVDNAPKGASILWDEADDLGANWSSEILIALKRKFKRIRKQNLKILLCTPTFHDLNKYFAIVRTRALFHIYADGLERGYFRFFARESKKRLYIKGKKEMDLGCAHPDFHGKFPKIPKGFPIDMEDDGEYDLKKDAATKASIREKEPRDYRQEVYYRFIDWLETRQDIKKLLKRKDQEVCFGITERTMQVYDREREDRSPRAPSTDELKGYGVENK